MSTPAGWYPDPAEPSQARWWDGQNWSGQTAPRAAIATPGESMPAPRYGEYAPAPPVVSTPQDAASSYTLPAWPSAAPVAPQTAPVQGLDTSTPWIWLSILVAHLPVLFIFLIDWDGYFEIVLSLQTGSDVTAATAAMTEWMAGLTGISLMSYVCMGASIVFAWLDHRALVARGIRKPFHWAFAFLALVVSIGVYIIGRTVVVKRQTGKGMGPLWGWIAATVLVIVISIAFVSAAVDRALEMIPY